MEGEAIYRAIVFMLIVVTFFNVIENNRQLKKIRKRLGDLDE